MRDQSGESSAVSADGVTVEKRLNHEHPEHIAVIFDIRSERLDPVTVRILDSVPPANPVGFHPDFGGRHWSITEDGVRFTRGIDPAETYRTVYGVGNVADADIRQLSAQPTVELVDASDDARHSDAAGESDSTGVLDDRATLDLDEVVDSRSLDPPSGEHSEPPADGGESEKAHSGTSPDQQPESTAGGGDEPIEESLPSEFDTGRAVTVVEGGVSVEKSLDTSMFSFPAIVFTISSSLDEPVVIRIADPIPDPVSADDVGFHHRFGSDFWDQRDRTVVFERQLDPAEELTTLYAIREPDDRPDLDSFDEPNVTIRNTMMTASDTGSHTDEDDAGGADRPEPERPVGKSPSEMSAASTRSDGATDEGFLAELFSESNSSATETPRPAADSSADRPGQAGSDDDGESATEPDSGATESRPTPGEEPVHWIPASLVKAVDDLEAVAETLAAASASGERRTAERRAAFEAVSNDLAAVQKSIATVDDRSARLLTGLDRLEKALSALERSMTETWEGRDTLGSELKTGLDDQTEEISLIKSSLASNREETYQLRTTLDELNAELTAKSDAVHRTAERMESVTTAVDSIESSLSELRSGQEALREAVTSIEEAIDENDG